jgi:hypothetical protein
MSSSPCRAFGREGLGRIGGRGRDQSWRGLTDGPTTGGGTPPSSPPLLILGPAQTRRRSQRRRRGRREEQNDRMAGHASVSHVCAAVLLQGAFDHERLGEGSGGKAWRSSRGRGECEETRSNSPLSFIAIFHSLRSSRLFTDTGASIHYRQLCHSVHIRRHSHSVPQQAHLFVSATTRDSAGSRDATGLAEPFSLL